jgi:hypothetical protein
MSRKRCAGVVMFAPSWSTFSTRSSDLAAYHGSLASAGVCGMFLHKCWGRALNNSDADALIRTHAAVEDTVDQASILQLRYSSSRKSNQNHITSRWLPLHRSQAHLFQARLVR